MLSDPARTGYRYIHITSSLTISAVGLVTYCFLVFRERSKIARSKGGEGGPNFIAKDCRGGGRGLGNFIARLMYKSAAVLGNYFY